jgi:2-polyprenyl-3-methyl-5-hydroxy-6-metoxy-1,4-benzoquinol methylase
MEKTYSLYGETRPHHEVKAFFERYRDSIRRDFDRHMVIPKHIPMHSYVLDYGCGWGTLAEIVHTERKCRVDGIDLDAHSIEIAREFTGEREGLSFSTRSIQTIHGEHYDIVLSSEVIEHTFNPGNYLHECNRVLKPGGLLVISLPNIMTPRYILSTLFGNALRRFEGVAREAEKGHNRTHHHIQAWDPTTFCRLACVTGFHYVGHEFLEGQAWPFNKYWRHPWGRLRNLSCKILFKFEKDRVVSIQPND